MSEAEKARLTALKAKADKTTEEIAELEALEAKAKSKADDDPMYSEAYVKSLRSEAAKYRTRLKEMEEQLAKVSTIDPAEYEKLKQAAEESEKKKLEEKGEFNKLREQLIEAHKAELLKKDNEIVECKKALEALNAELERTIMANEITVAASLAKAINPKLVEMVAMQSMKVETLEDGRRVPRIVDAEGNVRIDIKTGKPVTVIEYLEELKQAEEYAHLFAGAKTGAASNTTLTFQGQKIQNPWKKESFNLTQQARILRQDAALAARLKEEAGVA